MSISIAHLGPPGTYAEAAALAYCRTLASKCDSKPWLCPYPSIAQTLHAVAQGQADLAVVPVENSIEGSVTITLDTLWQLDQLQIQQALVLPIQHALLSRASRLQAIQTVYSHPQALAQCQGWLQKCLPSVQLIPTNSTTEALQHLDTDYTAGAISSQRAALLYQLPILAAAINDYPDNCTRFWIISSDVSDRGSHLSLAFSLPKNAPGALVKALEIFARREINLSKIESRPTKRYLGEYIFFIDLEGNSHDSEIFAALTELSAYTEVLKIFGNYNLLDIN
jgi:prephenate dehydratase